MVEVTGIIQRWEMAYSEFSRAYEMLRKGICKRELVDNLADKVISIEREADELGIDLYNQ